jgi:predicted nucleic acid-binding protein
MILELAVASHAACIITSDLHLLTPPSFSISYSFPLINLILNAIDVPNPLN